jgi:hypothetical protein
MKLCAKVVVATRQWLVATQAFAFAVGMHPDATLFKFMTSEDHQVAL